MLVLSAAVAVAGGQTSAPAQDRPDFSGRWTFERPPVMAVAPRGPDATVTPANELVVIQNEAALTVGHPSRPGSHPHSGVNFFASAGTTRAGSSYKSSVAWVGRELVIESTLELSASGGSVNMIRSIERWSMADDGRLEIRIVEERSGKEAVVETLAYRRSGNDAAR